MEIVQGERIADRFRVVEALGGSEHGPVFVVEDATRGDARVVLKPLTLDVASTPELRAELVSRVESVRSMARTDIAKVIEVTFVNGEPALVWEWIEGRSLEAIAPETVFPFLDLLSLIVQIAEGLEGLHQAGFAHRSLSMQNTVLRQDGSVVITDWALTSGPVSNEDAAVRSDIYALGMLTSELLLRTEVDSSTPALERMVERMLADPQSAGYTSIAAVLNDLGRLVRQKLQPPKGPGVIFVALSALILCTIIIMLGRFGLRIFPLDPIIK